MIQPPQIQRDFVDSNLHRRPMHLKQPAMNSHSTNHNNNNQMQRGGGQSQAYTVNSHRHTVGQVLAQRAAMAQQQAQRSSMAQQQAPRVAQQAPSQQMHSSLRGYFPSNQRQTPQQNTVQIRPAPHSAPNKFYLQGGFKPNQQQQQQQNPRMAVRQNQLIERAPPQQQQQQWNRNQQYQTPRMPKQVQHQQKQAMPASVTWGSQQAHPQPRPQPIPIARKRSAQTPPTPESVENFSDYSPPETIAPKRSRQDTDWKLLATIEEVAAAPQKSAEPQQVQKVEPAEPTPSPPQRRNSDGSLPDYVRYIGGYEIRVIRAKDSDMRIFPC